MEGLDTFLRDFRRLTAVGSTDAGRGVPQAHATRLRQKLAGRRETEALPAFAHPDEADGYRGTKSARPDRGQPAAYPRGPRLTLRASERLPAIETFGVCARDPRRQGQLSRTRGVPVFRRIAGDRARRRGHPASRSFSRCMSRARGAVHRGLCDDADAHPSTQDRR